MEETEKKTNSELTKSHREIKTKMTNLCVQVQLKVALQAGKLVCVCHNSNDETF